MSITITKSRETGQYIATINYPAGIAAVACLGDTITAAVALAAARIEATERHTIIQLAE